MNTKKTFENVSNKLDRENKRDSKVLLKCCLDNISKICKNIVESVSFEINESISTKIEKNIKKLLEQDYIENSDDLLNDLEMEMFEFYDDVIAEDIAEDSD